MTPADGDPWLARVPFDRVLGGARSGIPPELLGGPGPHLVIVDDQAAWARFWFRHTRQAVDPGPPPEVDLEERWIAAVLLGERPTGGYAVEITSVTYDDPQDRYAVRCRVTEPAPGAILTQSLTSPFDIVAVLRIPDTPPMADLVVES